MKLFIVNKEEFDKDFPFSQKEIHRKAYNHLLQCLGYDESVPNSIDFDFEMFNIKFEFTNKVGDVYFFLYSRI